MYTVGSLFSGIGGIDLAAEWAGFQIVYQVEINEFCTTILEKHWPGLLRRRDVRECSAANLPYVDLMAGGFPCQPHSVAGRRAGSEDSRNLWPDFRRLIGDLRPRAVLLENVPGLLTTMGTGILADFAALGYVGRTGIISAADAGAPHKRERWFCVAYDNRQRQQQPQGVIGEQRGWVGYGHKTMGNPDIFSLARKRTRRKQVLESRHETQKPQSTGNDAQFLCTNESRLGRDPNGLSNGMDGPYHCWPAGQGNNQYDWEPLRVTTRHDFRKARLEALGNAVVPQVVYPLMVSIREWLDLQAELDESER